VAACPSAPGQVGYLNAVYTMGTNLIANPLDSGSNTLSALFPSLPEGSSISFWDPTTQSFSSTSVFTASQGWSPDGLLPPGQGALLNATADFINTFQGLLLEPDGSPYDSSSPLRFPLPDLPTGTYLFSSKTVVNLGKPGFEVFRFVLGRGPQEGEQFTWFDSTNQAFHSTTYTSGAWDNGAPALPMCTSAFFRIYASPRLRFAHAAHGVALSWTNSVPDFLLEVCTNLSGSPIWTPVTDGVVTNATSFVFTSTQASPSTFYRLRRR